MIFIISPTTVGLAGRLRGKGSTLTTYKFILFDIHLDFLRFLRLLFTLYFCDVIRILVTVKSFASRVNDVLVTVDLDGPGDS